MLKHSWIRRSAPWALSTKNWLGVVSPENTNAEPVPFQPVAHRTVVDVDRREAFDHDAVALVDHAGLSEIELVDLDLGAGVRQQTEPRVGVPGEDSICLRTKCPVPYFGSGPDGPYSTSGFTRPPAQLADPDLREVADVVGVQMGGEIGGDVLVRNFERGEIRLRAGAEIHDELVAVAELDQPRAFACARRTNGRPVPSAMTRISSAASGSVFGK